MKPCPLCRAVARTTLYRGTRSGDVHRCTACGFVYSDPAADLGPPRPHCKDDPEVYWLNARERLGLLAKVTGITSGPLLDVGCFDGSFLLAANRLGFTGEGIEPEAEAAATARARGVAVQGVNFAEARFDHSFAVVAMIHTLEHLPDPWAALEKARGLLVPQGALLLELPNFDCFSRRLMGKHWRQFIHDHLQFFEPATLSRCLTQKGFPVRHLQTTGKTASLRLVADRVERYYSAALGRGFSRLVVSLGWSERTVSLNLGDIMVAVATVG